MTPEQYARSGHNKVRGWLATQDALVITKLAKAQTIDGGACEIGVHHGRLFILLHLLTTGPSVAIDLFDSQDENTDGSGHGSLTALRANLTKFGESERLQVIARNSLQVSSTDIKETAQGCIRIFSVDGGHTAECTYNDLMLARNSTRTGSLVILDDYFNRFWPAVSEGAAEFMKTHPLALQPVYIGMNKFIFSVGDSTPFRSILHGAQSHVFGHPVVVAHSPSIRSRLARSWLWRALKAR